MTIMAKFNMYVWDSTLEKVKNKKKNVSSRSDRHPSAAITRTPAPYGAHFEIPFFCWSADQLIQCCKLSIFVNKSCFITNVFAHWFFIQTIWQIKQLRKTEKVFTCMLVVSERITQQLGILSLRRTCGWCSQLPRWHWAEGNVWDLRNNQTCPLRLWVQQHRKPLWP